VIADAGHDFDTARMQGRRRDIAGSRSADPALTSRDSGESTI
jgi:hypothetical protein